MLHVTNGDSVSLRDAGLGGEVLVWDDVLHRPPTPVARENLLAQAPLHDEVALWFEHDLYDQVQLIDILDCFQQHPHTARRLTLISSGIYLGWLTGEQLAVLWPSRHDVTAAELELASAAWRAYRSPDPHALVSLLAGDTSALPYLHGALLRYLQQLPSVSNGLARSQRQILQLLAEKPQTFSELFRRDQLLEERIFMGDTTFQQYLDGLATCRHPLVVENEGRFQITDAGREILAGRADHALLNGLTAPWRWDDAILDVCPSAGS